MTQTQNLAQAKKTMRAQQGALRRHVRAKTGDAAAKIVADLAPDLGIAAGTVVGAYWPLGDELDPRPLMGRLERTGCLLALPVVVAPDHELEFRAFRFGDVLEAGPHGTCHPSVTQARLFPQVLLIPLLAFDQECFRLGYGGGYYDRTLESLRKNVQVRAIGLAFAAQKVAAVPRDALDQRLDMVATELGLITPETA